jgi:protein phosphatase
MAGAADALSNWDAAGATNRGRVRRRNEDAILVRPDLRLFAVADGMGGHAAGNVASAIAIQTLVDAIPRAPSTRIGVPGLGKRLRQAFVAANTRIMERSATRPSEAGMGTTLTAVATLASQPGCVIAHVGDSRVYRHRPNAVATEPHMPAFQQLTTDHTWVQNQVDAGALSPEQARVHPWSSILTRVLGMEQPGAADIVVSDARDGDTFLLCSDGLTGMIEDDAIAALVARPLPLLQICKDLIDAANARGGRDNISVVLLKFRA